MKFPEESKDFSLNWIKKNKLPRFKTLNQVLTKENIRKNSNKTKNIFPLKEVYSIYSNFSEIMHGNPYHLRSNLSLKTERFWIIAMLVITSCLFIELIDDNYVKKTGAKDFRDLLNLVKENRVGFTEEWLSVKKSSVNKSKVI